MDYVYIVIEWYDDYPEEGGGFQCVLKGFTKEEDAKKFAEEFNAEYSEDRYYYSVEKISVERQ